MDEAVRERLAAVQERIESAARRAGRDPSDVTLVAVSKRQPAEAIAAAVRAGVRHLGENYVQETEKKRPLAETLIGSEDLTRRMIWHMIGGLQRNKAAAAVSLFDVVESVDRPTLAAALGRRAEAAGGSLDVLLQVNLSGEEQKSGAPEAALPALLAECHQWSALCVRGLMTVPAANPDPEASRPAFAALRALRDALRTQPGGSEIEHLSMGMSADFEVAIEEGATWVRVGTAIFGPRPT
jgi:pyridoxal phosphate enzyme (YggS family)